MTTTSEDEVPDEAETTPPVRSDAYISADIEADGPIPGRYSMLAIGMCIAGEQDAAGTFRPIQPESARFYRELKPISEEFDQEALDAIAGTGLDRERLKTEGTDPAAAMTEAARWVLDLADGRRPVFVGWPMGYDWMFLPVVLPHLLRDRLALPVRLGPGHEDDGVRRHPPRARRAGQGEAARRAGAPAPAHPPRPRRRRRAGRAVPEPPPLADAPLDDLPDL